MAYTIANLKTDLEGILHGTSLNKVRGVFPLINRGARDLLLDIDPQETKRRAQITNALYDRVYDYAVPADLKGNKIIDIRPQVRRSRSDNFSQEYSEQFDLKKTNNTFQVAYDTGVKTVRISKSVKTPVTLNNMNSVTANGTWAVGGDATNISTDTVNYVAGSGSVKFDLDGSTTSGYIENLTMSAVNLTEHENESALFNWLFIPDTSIFTSVDLRWGSDSSNYWNRTVTTPHIGSLENGWNLFRYDWNGATETGSPVVSAVDYGRVTINYDGTADTDFRVDNIVSNIGQIYEMVYYSKYIFSDSSGNFQEQASDDSDTVNLDTESYNLLTYRVAELMAQQVQGEDAKFDAPFFAGKYAEALRQYNAQYKSEVEKPRASYYPLPRKRRFRVTRR